ncbi:sugar phosphate isomerase/epimerase [Polynucleobacter paneuropaeus]|nr:sugar phosphate isomerase/epimerase [Polynucleobacter paneuropaeus]
MIDRIGFMQGRLSPLVDGRIQAFPWSCWQDEFAAAEQHQFRLMEWTLDQERLYENPLLTPAGQAEITHLGQKHGVEIASLTGDCFMQSPFWKTGGSKCIELQNDFRAVVRACSKVGISMIVLPLVDNGRLETGAEEDVLVDFLQGEVKLLNELRVKVAFESDFAPVELARFIERLEPAIFGVNYDIGNSASLGMNPTEEIGAYGHRIVNVHIKDRMLSGTTVPLGTGSADFEAVFAGLARASYAGNYILQTARAADGNHAAALCRYRDMAIGWINKYGA